MDDRCLAFTPKNAKLTPGKDPLRLSELYPQIHNHDSVHRIEDTQASVLVLGRVPFLNISFVNSSKIGTKIRDIFITIFSFLLIRVVSSIRHAHWITIDWLQTVFKHSFN